MYRYDEFDRALVLERVEQFRGQVARRLSGELEEEEFADDFYDFTEIDTKFRIVSDLED